MPYISLHNRFPRQVSHLLAVYFSKYGSRNDSQRTPGLECSVPRDVTKLSQGERRTEDTHRQWEEEEDKETNQHP